jgi:hypothetical protein
MRSLVTENSIKFGLGSRIRSRICRKESHFHTSLKVERPALTLAAARGDEYRSLGRVYKALGGGWQQ